MKRDHRTGLGLLLAGVAYAGWGLLAPVGKLLLVDFGPLGLNAVRMTAALALLLPFLPREVMRAGLSYLRRPAIVAIVLVGGALDLVLYFYALRYVDATYAALGFYTAPLWTALLARMWARERVGRLFLPCVALMLVGGYIALRAPGGGAAEGFHPFGMVLAVATGAGWAFYTVGLRVHAPGLRLRPLLFASLLTWAGFFVVTSLVVEGVPALAAVPGSSWAWMVLYAAVPTVACYLLFNAALRHAPAGPVNLLVGLEVAFTVLFAAVIIGDRYSLVQLAGVALVLASVSVYLASRSWPKAPPPTPA